MKYIIGFVDDLEDMIAKYIKKFKRSDIDVIYAENCLTFKDIFEWILDNKINYLLVDYKLQQKYDFSGSELIRYINNKVPDLHCIIFSSVNDINDDLVMKNNIKEKSIIELRIDDPKYKEFIAEIKDGAKVFETRKQISLEEYKDLLTIKITKGFKNAADEERFIFLYKILVSYGLIDKIPSELLKSTVEEKIDILLDKLNKYVN